MAICHITAKMMSRSSRNTVRATAYRSGCKLVDKSIGQSFDYQFKDVAHCELLLPGESPQWTHEIQELVSANRDAGVQAFCDITEEAERRKDSQVYRELEFALPQELSDAQNIELAKAFLQDQVCGKGIGVLANFHFDVDLENGERRPHCHALLLTRKLTASGLSLHKEVEWNQKEFLLDLREQYAAYTNFHLALHGHTARIDHRSYAEQGIDLEAQPKLGKKIIEIEKHLGGDLRRDAPEPFTDKGLSYQLARLRNLYRILKRPEIVFEMVTRHQGTFMWGDVQKALGRYVDDVSLFQRLEEKLKASQELILLKLESFKTREGVFEEQEIYTTRLMVSHELSLVESCERLKGPSSKHEVRKEIIASVLESAEAKFKERGGDDGRGGGLSVDQVQGIRHLVGSQRLASLIGFAGTGKSTALSICQEMWKQEGLRVYGLAPTGRAAENLIQEGISSVTLDRFLREFDQGRCRYSSQSVLVLDEAGMVDLWRFSRFLKAVETLGAKAVVMGDGGQLQPVQAGSPFRFVQGVTGSVKLTQIIRQKQDWQKEATQLFGELKTKEALQQYMDQGRVHFIEEKGGQGAREGSKIDLRQETKMRLLEDWQASLEKHPGQIHLLLASTRKDMQALNAGARFLMKSSGKLELKETHYTVCREEKDDFGAAHLFKEQKEFSVGDRIVFLRNDKGLGVRNGSLGTLVSCHKQRLVVRLDETQGGQKDVSFAPQLYGFFDHGWALTIHKSQGTTVDRSFVLASSYSSRNLSYVAMTRHREDVQVYGSTLDFRHQDQFIKSMSRVSEKLSAQDYLKPEELQKLVKEEDKWLTAFFKEMSQRLEAIGFVTKQAFQSVADHFLGESRSSSQSQPSSSSPLDIYAYQLTLSEEKRAGKLFESSEALSSHADPAAPFLTPQHFQSMGSKATSSVHSIPSHYSVEDVEQALKGRIRDLAEDLLGAPNHHASNNHTLRFGRTGKIVVHVSGSKEGLWHDFSAGEGGNIFQLYQRERGGGFQESLQELAAYSGVQPGESIWKSARSRSTSLSVENENEIEDVERLKKVSFVKTLFEKSPPIAGTVAERYLREHRGILGELPADLRFLPAQDHPSQEKTSFPALAAFARDVQGEIAGVQVTYLNPETAAKADIEIKKRSLGVIKGSFVTLQKGPGPVYVAEGVETALSIKEAKIEGTILASLGVSNFKNIPVEEGRPIIICADHDAPGSASEKAVLKAVAALQEKGAQVQVIQPKHQGQDFNDVLKEEGTQKVRELVEKGSSSLSIASQAKKWIQEYEDLEKKLDHAPVDELRKYGEEIRALRKQMMAHSQAFEKIKELSPKLAQEFKERKQAHP